MRFPLQPILLGLAALLALGATTRSIGAEEIKSMRYVCPDGERFSVDYKRSHARLRNGDGVFSLTADGGMDGGTKERRYSDGNLILSPHDGGAILQRPGQAGDDCRSVAQRS